VLVAACASDRPPPEAPRVASVPCTPDRIGRVTVTGAREADVPQLAVLAGTADDDARTERTTATATAYLRAHGFTRAQVAVARRAGCYTDLAVSVALGPKYHITRIAFETDAGDDFPNATRLAILEDALGTVNTPGGTYIEDRFVRALAALQQRYRDAGWLDAAVGSPVATLGAAGAITVTVPIDAGPRFRIAVMRARGAGPEARDRLLATLGVAPGDYFDGPRLRLALDRARNELGRPVVLRAAVSDDDTAVDLEAVMETKP
jgi:outer membrane protein assembly factor BamA